MNTIYGSTTKALKFMGKSYGRLTLGLGASLVNPGQDPYKATHPVFYATAPFARESPLLLIAGYESPALGPFGLGIDHIGGYSEISATNVAVNLTPIDGATMGVGGFFGSDPSAFYAGMFAYIFVNFNIFKAFGKKEGPAPTPKSL